MPRQRKSLRFFRTTWSTWSNGKTINLTQKSILMWRFRCGSRHSLLNSQVCLSRKVDNNGYWKIVWECNSSYSRHLYIYTSFTDLSMRSAQIVIIKSFKWPDVNEFDLADITSMKRLKIQNSVGESAWSSDLPALTVELSCFLPVISVVVYCFQWYMNWRSKLFNGSTL